LCEKELLDGGFMCIAAQALKLQKHCKPASKLCTVINGKGKEEVEDDWSRT